MIPVAEQATCSWGRFHPAEPCANLSPYGHAGEVDVRGEPVTRYCPEHTEAFWAILDEPILPARGARGIRKGGDGHRDDSPEAQERKRRHGAALTFVESYRGTWGLPLDIRSDARWGTKYMKLSERQVDALLAGKAREAVWQAERESVEDDLHHVAWRAMIDAFIAARQPAVTAPDLGGHPVWSAPVAADGMYRKAGVTYKVQTAIHGSGKRYAKRLDEQARQFVYAPGAITTLSADDRMTLEEAEAFGKLYGFCCVCAATLTDEKSIARGIGPICGKRV